MKKTKFKLRPWVIPTMIGLIVFAILLCVNKLLDNDMEDHIIRVSQECASKGYGIKATYTKNGDKYYICNY